MSHQDPTVVQWGADGLFFTEAGRGGPLAWRVGASALEGDALGPTRHVHDGAAEYYFMYSGSAHVETGGIEFVLEEGELGYIPPDAPHNFLGNATDQDACLFCVVGPNYVTNKWRIDDFLPGSEDLRMEVARPFEHDGPLPAGGTLNAHPIVLVNGDAPLERKPQACETIYIVCDGGLDVSLFGGLHGTLERGTYLHLRDGVEHRLSSTSGCKVLQLDLVFAKWAGVPRTDASPPV